MSWSQLVSACNGDRRRIAHYAWRLVLSGLKNDAPLDVDNMPGLPPDVAQVAHELGVLRELDEQVFAAELEYHLQQLEAYPYKAAAAGPPPAGTRGRAASLSRGPPVQSAPATPAPVPVALPESPRSELIRKSEAGDALSQFKLGVMYRAGKGVPQDYAEAHKWLSKAADFDHVDAISNLAYMYKKGMGLDGADLSTAAVLYRRAANLGSHSAAYNFGIMCLEGQGVEADSDLAIEYLRIAAETPSLVAAQYNLAYLLEETGDIEEAKKFYTIAAGNGDKASIESLERLG